LLNSYLSRVSEDEIAEARQLVGFQLPPDYLELLRFCNGEQGVLDAAPLLFVLYEIAAAIE
jgi:hypothetical protein